MRETGFLDSLLVGFKDANKTKLDTKTRSIEALPLILKQCTTREHVDTVCTQVGKYVAEAFPISSADLVRGTAPYIDYMAQLDQVYLINIISYYFLINFIFRFFLVFNLNKIFSFLEIYFKNLFNKQHEYKPWSLKNGFLSTWKKKFFCCVIAPLHSYIDPLAV